MKDRQPLYPNRVLITPEDGSPAFYATMTRADEPIQAGDPLNKATLLSDNVAAMYGLDATALPNDLFGYVGYFAQHSWFRKVVPNFRLSTASSNARVVIVDASSGSSGSEIAYWAEASVDLNHEIELANAYTSNTITYNTYTRAEELRGRYIRKDGAVYYVPSDAAASRDNNGSGYRVMIQGRLVSVVDNSAPGPDTYLQSSDRNAYPDSGESGGYAYTYMGRSLEHVLREPVRVVSGFYYGKGLIGAANPNRLEFPFKKVLALFVTEQDGDMASFAYLGQPGQSATGNAFTESEGALEWYSEDSVNTQFNVDNVYYHYLAIGIDTDRKEN